MTVMFLGNMGLVFALVFVAGVACGVTATVVFACCMVSAARAAYDRERDADAEL